MNDKSLSSLPNIGKTLEKKLHEVGIDTINSLKETGSENAFLRLEKPEGVPCINMLFALEGAVQGVRWHQLNTESKQRVKEFYNLWKTQAKRKNQE